MDPKRNKQTWFAHGRCCHSDHAANGCVSFWEQAHVETPEPDIIIKFFCEPRQMVSETRKLVIKANFVRLNSRREHWPSGSRLCVASPTPRQASWVFGRTWTDSMRHSQHEPAVLHGAAMGLERTVFRASPLAECVGRNSRRRRHTLWAMTRTSLQKSHQQMKLKKHRNDVLNNKKTQNTTLKTFFCVPFCRGNSISRTRKEGIPIETNRQREQRRKPFF